MAACALLIYKAPVRVPPARQAVLPWCSFVPSVPMASRLLKHISSFPPGVFAVAGPLPGDISLGPVLHMPGSFSALGLYYGDTSSRMPTLIPPAELPHQSLLLAGFGMDVPYIDLTICHHLVCWLTSLLVAVTCERGGSSLSTISNPQHPAEQVI